MPRVLLGVLIGAALAVSGAVMQGPVPQSARRSRPDRRLGRLQPRRGRRHRAWRDSPGAANRLARHACAAARGLLSAVLRRHWCSISVATRQRANLGRHHAARRHRAGGACHGADRHPDLHGRRPAAARPDFLAARLARPARPGRRSVRSGRSSCWRWRRCRSWRGASMRWRSARRPPAISAFRSSG